MSYPFSFYLTNRNTKQNSIIWKKWLISIFLAFIFSVYFAFSQSTLVTSVEAENGTLYGTNISSSVSGYSGTGYVTGFDNNQDQVSVTVTIPSKGLYKLVIRYNSTLGDKTQDLIINSGASSSIVFPKTTTYSDLNAGKFTLNAGYNTITIKSNWGWMDIDKFSIYTAVKNTYNITPNPIDANATDETKALYSFLVSHFGKKIISGQTNDYYENIKTITGQYPLLRAYDFQHFTVGYPYLWQNGGFSFGWHDDGSVQNAINWYNSTNKKGIVSFHWHWHSPSGGTVGTNTFYTDKTTFDVSKAVQAGTTENTQILRDIDSIASQLKKLQNAGVSILWRPLHEAGGAWFWWGAKGAASCKALYDILYDRLTNYHKLHNLIWVWSTPETDWYPGNNKTDIIGYDSYPGDFNYATQKTTFDRLYNLTGGQKIIAMSENGPIPDPDQCLADDAPWSYFMSWSDLVTKQNSQSHIQDVYANTNVLSVGFVETNVSVSELSNTGKYKIFPNPASAEINIEGDYTSIELLDLNGRILFSTSGLQKKIELGSFKDGLYIVRIFNHHEVSNYNLIIRKKK